MFRSLSRVLPLVLGLAGCGGLRLVDSEVRSFATPPPIPAGASYRFERLPSQQLDAVQQIRLETLAQQALAKVGLRRLDSAASYSVQVAASLRVDPYSPWIRPTPGWGPGWNLGLGLQTGNVLIGVGGPFMGMGGFAMGEPPYYWRQVSLVIRSLSNQQVVYETHAAHDGPWADSEAVLPAMLDAALQGFPTPPPGVRRIAIEIPR